MKRTHFAAALLTVLSTGFATPGAFAADKVPLFTSSPTVMVRSHDPGKLAQYYVAIGFKLKQTSATTGTSGFVLENDAGILEVLKADKDLQVATPKTNRKQQGVVAIFETTDVEAVVARAKAAGATMIEKWDATEGPISIYYIADPENNVLGFAPRHHNKNLKTP